MEPLRAAIGCVAHARLILERSQTARTLEAQTQYTLALDDMKLITAQGNVPISMSLRLNIQILQLEDAREPFAVSTTKYFYILAATDDKEILAFHWSPSAVGDAAVRLPHLHVGRAVVTEATQVLPRTFHKVYVPTGFVSVPSVMRLAIAEFGVRPLRPNWRDILDQAEATSTQ